MTDISVIKMIISVAVWRIYPSWVNDKLRAWEGHGHSRMLWPRLSRDDFRSKLEIISFLSRVKSVSKSFLASHTFEKCGAKRSSSWAFGFDDVLEAFSKTPLRHRALFANSDYDHEFWKFPLFFFQSRARVTWLTAMAIPRLSKALWWCYVENQNENLTSERWQDRADHWPSTRLVRFVGGNPGPWSKRQKKKTKKKTQGCQRLIVRGFNPSSSTNQRVLRSMFPRPNVATVLHFAFIMYVDVQLQDGQAVARGKRRKTVIRVISGVDHRGVTNLSAPISSTGQGHCTVFRHVMELSLLVLC